MIKVISRKDEFYFGVRVTQSKVRKFRLTTRDGRVLLEEEFNGKAVDIRDVDSVVEVFRVIFSESRYRVVRQIAEKPCCFTALHDSLGYSQKTIAQCLDDLLRVNAIVRDREGYMLSTLGKIILAQMKEMALLLKKVRDVEDLTMEFE